MGGHLADLLAKTVQAVIIVAFVLGVALTLFFTLVLPKLWEWLKPLVHQWTA
jgi:hypothetical protein